jgi:XTP/dITP diphosphohydrolase
VNDQADTFSLVMASANPHKVQEIDDLLSVLLPGCSVVARPASVGEVIEDADTLIGNARLKAVAIASATGCAAIADDTGLFVDALGDLPGVHTARFAGPGADADANIDRLLRELSAVGAVTAAQRRAVFRTVALVVFPDGTEVCGEGEVVGHITEVRSGAAGFGYDPVFQPDGSTLTFASMTLADKQAISHRGRAFVDLAGRLRHRHGR